MKDVLTKFLDTRLANKIANLKPAGTEQPGTGSLSKFDQVLQSKKNDMLMDKMSQIVEQNSNLDTDMEVMSADNIKINIQSGEFNQDTNFGVKNGLGKLFSIINDDSNKLSTIVEVLAKNPNVSRGQLLAYQAHIGALSLNVEMFSKLAQTLSQNINTLLQTNMG